MVKPYFATRQQAHVLNATRPVMCTRYSVFHPRLPLAYPAIYASSSHNREGPLFVAEARVAAS